MVFHETIEAQLEEQNLDKIFEEKEKNATPEKTKEIKDKAGDIFGKNFNPDYKKEIKNNLDNPEDNKDITDINALENGESEIFKENSKYLPILDRLVETEQLSENARNIVLGADLDKVNFDSIEGLEPEEKKLLKGTFYNIESGENNKKQNLIEFKNDIKSIEKNPELKSFDFSIEKNNFNSEVLNKIGENYLKFPDKNGKFDEIKDLSVAINITKIQILKEVKNIPVDTETYKVAIQNIESKDVKKQLEGIESLYTLAYSKEGELGKTTLDKYKNKRKKALKDEAIKIDNQLKLETTQNNQVLLDELNKRKQEIIKEMSELTGIKKGQKTEEGDIFKSTKLDAVSNNTED